MRIKVVIAVAIISIILLLLLQQNLIRNQPKTVSNEELLQSLSNKIDSIKEYRDSLQIVVDTSKVKIIEIEKRYETVRDRIISQSVDSDCITFANYISNYSGLSDNNNSSTTESN